MFKFFEQLIEPFPKEQIQQPPATFLKFIIFYTRGVWKYLFFVSILSALIAMGEALFFFYMGKFVDILTQSTPSTFWRDNSLVFVSFFVMLLIILPILILLHHLILNQCIRVTYPMQIRYRMHRYLLRQSLSFFNNDYAGRISQKVMQSALGVRDTVLKFCNVIVHMLVYFITMLGMLAETNVYLMLVMFLWLIVYIVIMFKFIPKLRNISKDNAEKRSIMVGGVVDSYSNIQTVKLFSKNSEEEKYAVEKFGNCMESEFKMMRTVTKFDLSVQFLNYILICSLVALSLYLWVNNLVLLGAIAVSLGLAIRVNNLSQWVMWEVGLLFENIGNVQNGMETISKPLEIIYPEDSERVPKNMHSEFSDNIITFKAVGFSYNNKVKVFDNLDLYIKKGEKIGIVGHSGSGKSTLVNLLLRFYDVDKGQILVNNHDVKEYSQDDLRSLFAMVTQDVSLLHRSIRDNILYGNTNCYSQDVLELKMKEAVKQANAMEFIEKLCDAKGNKGFDTIVGERGTRLSGGQRQRIAIARVILKNAPILILDEATSALDSESEIAIKDNLTKLMENKTVIAIAHRLSTIAAMDRLIVLKDGEIVENGTHEDLLKLKGIYASLWNKQTNGFIGK
ncbi:MAG: ABC transporter ATP-binding protein [Succinivibrionaceae bacterium]